MEPQQPSLHYQVPSWAGKPPPGFHLDVTKEGKLFQKLMIDEKKCYHFGRNPTLNEICIDHQSCSRVHAALVYHKHLDRCFLVDLGSTHGTYIGNVRIEGHKPTQLPVNSTFHFGASTRYYTLREKPNIDGTNVDSVEILPMNLPESEMELDNLTEYNTANNKRISMVGIREDDLRNRKQRTVLVRFKEEEDVINPEDVDPNVGRFRNLVQSTVIPKKRLKLDSPVGRKDGRPNLILKQQSGLSNNFTASNSIFSASLSIKLGLPSLNPVPEVDLDSSMTESRDSSPDERETSTSEGLPRRKRYAKEAWPGKQASVI